MAKQVINVGQAANDGTGDALRTAMQKVVSNFDELYDDQFSGAYDDLTGVPNTLIGNFGITDGSNNQVLTTDGNGNLTFKAVTAAIDTADIDAHLNTSTAANNQILSWTGADYDWVDQASGGSGGGLSNTEIINLVTGSDLDMDGNKVLFGNVYDELGDLPTAGDYHGMFAHVHATGKAYYAHAGNWVRLADFSEVGGGSGGLPTRSNKSGTTASLANNASGNLDITGHKSYSLFTITTDKAAWVRIYANGASRTADASRAETSDPAPDAGVIAEVITTGAETVLVSPGVIGYNLESTPTTTIPCAVKNKSGSTGTVQVTLNVLQLEAD